MNTGEEPAKEAEEMIAEEEAIAREKSTWSAEVDMMLLYIYYIYHPL